MHSLSVIVPAHNGTAFLGEALESVFAQTVRPREVIVVDDASTDGTPELILSLAARAPVPVRLIRLRKNSGGPARPMNVGAAAAAGELVAVLDQDDVFAPTKLEEQANALARNPDLALVFSCTGRYDNREVLTHSPEAARQLLGLARTVPGCQRVEGAELLRLLIRHDNFTWGYPALLFRRRDWARKGGFDERLRIASDYDFVCWLGARGPVGFIPHPLNYRRLHGRNLSGPGVATAHETARVKARYLLEQRWLLDDPEFSRALRDEFLTWAYWVKMAGHHRRALHWYYLAGRVWGWKPGVLWSLAKVPPQWLTHKVGLRPAVYSFWTRPRAAEE